MNARSAHVALVGQGNRFGGGASHLVAQRVPEFRVLLAHGVGHMRDLLSRRSTRSKRSGRRPSTS
jgi:hypothetical protein